MNFYIEKDGKPVPCDVSEFGIFFEDSDNRRVEYDTLDIDGHKVEVSTVFLGIDHSFGRGEPILYETMIFGGKHDQYQYRYRTRKDAKEAHDRIVNDLKEGTFLNEKLYD
jgi:hypothetical protein